MCYEEGKLRIIKAKAHHPPLILNKKHNEQREKENEKHNFDLHAKPRGYHHPELATTTEFEHKPVTSFQPAPHHQHHAYIPKERYAPHPHPPAHTNYFVQTTKTLTFANVKQGPKQPEPVSFVGLANDGKKQSKGNVLLERECFSNMTDRADKPLIDKGLEKKDNAKMGFALKPSTVITAPDDFACTEELDFKPVEKKSLLPQKKYNAEKTTSKFDFAKPKKMEKIDKMEKMEKIDKKNDAKQLREFEATEKMINITSEGDALNLLCLKQQEYAVDPNYLQKHHKGLIWWSRAILIDWMRHICYQFGLLRDTYHIAVVLLDRYLAQTSNVPKSILQAIGATCLFIASKLEQFQCRESREFVKSTNNSCSIHDIHELEIKIVKTLRFQLNPPTVSSLANMMMSQWDIFVSGDLGKNHPLFDSLTPVHFKLIGQNSYRLFRQMMQLIDCSAIDIQTAQYSPKMLICSFLYLLIGREMSIFQAEEIVREFPCSSLYLLDEGSDFNDLFGCFVVQVFGFSLLDMLPTVQYCATYFQLIFSFQKPVIRDETDLEFMSLEEYCSYQTYNSTMIKTVKHRYRGLY